MLSPNNSQIICCGSELTTATALRLKKVLDVPTGTPPVLFLRAPCICGHFLHLATKIRELFGFNTLLAQIFSMICARKQETVKKTG